MIDNAMREAFEKHHSSVHGNTTSFARCEENPDEYYWNSVQNGWVNFRHAWQAAHTRILERLRSSDCLHLIIAMRHADCDWSPYKCSDALIAMLGGEG